MTRQNINIELALGQLAIKRKIFHSEKDFQFALAWQLQSMYLNANIRLEKPISRPGGKGHADIWIELDDQFIIIELKYKTDEFEANSGGEFFKLTTDLNIKSIIKEIENDIKKVQHYLDDINEPSNKSAFVIVLTQKTRLHELSEWKDSWKDYSTVFGKCYRGTGMKRDENKFDEIQSNFKFIIL
jgi:hypothetical protein